MNWLPTESSLAELIEELNADIKKRGSEHAALIEVLKSDQAKVSAELLSLIDEYRLQLSSSSEELLQHGERAISESKAKVEGLEAELYPLVEQYKGQLALVKKSLKLAEEAHSKHAEVVVALETVIDVHIGSAKSELRSEFRQSFERFSNELNQTAKEHKSSLNGIGLELEDTKRRLEVAQQLINEQNVTVQKLEVKHETQLAELDQKYELRAQALETRLMIFTSALVLLNVLSWLI